MCLVDYKGSGHREIREIDRNTLFDYMEQFALPINVYGLKKDLLDSMKGDVTRLSAEMSQMRGRLYTLIDDSRCYYLSRDAADPENLHVICDLIRASNRH